MKEKMIRDYFLKFDFNSDWSYKAIREDLKQMLGEQPAIEIEWTKDVKIDEEKGIAKEVDDIESVQIMFIDEHEQTKLFKFKPTIK